MSKKASSPTRAVLVSEHADVGQQLPVHIAKPYNDIFFTVLSYSVGTRPPLLPLLRNVAHAMFDCWFCQLATLYSQWSNFRPCDFTEIMELDHEIIQHIVYKIFNTGKIFKSKLVLVIFKERKDFHAKISECTKLLGVIAAMLIKSKTAVQRLNAVNTDLRTRLLNKCLK